uniref:Uncharacterized protein n=1 Tax=Knipowitschia caucasica TaxID=637954 RepID=A0AAV2KUZ7_KNICA
MHSPENTGRSSDGRRRGSKPGRSAPPLLLGLELDIGRMGVGGSWPGASKEQSEHGGAPVCSSVWAARVGLMSCSMTPVTPLDRLGEKAWDKQEDRVTTSLCDISGRARDGQEPCARGLCAASGWGPVLFLVLAS